MIQDVWGKLRTLNDQGVLDALIWLGGRLFYVCPDGDDALSGTDQNHPLKTLEAAYALLRSGKNDAVVIMPNQTTGLDDTASSCTIRLDAAFSWSKPATHLVGLQPSFADLFISPRARLAPTSTTTAFANFFTVPAGVSGCLFRGIQWFHDFGTDTTAQVAVTVVSSRNVFQRCHIVGGANDDAANRSLLITTGTGNKGENLFEDCSIGADTLVARIQASGVLGFAGTGSARNWFRRCNFQSWAGGANPRMILAGANAIDRFAMFENCKFLNFGTALTSLMTINATQQGIVILENPTRYNCGNFGDTANTLVTGAVTVNTTGLGSAPAA